MKLTDLIKQLKREFKSGGEIEVTAISITPEGKVVIGGSFESGPVRAEPRIFDERVDDGPDIPVAVETSFKRTRPK